MSNDDAPDDFEDAVFDAAQHPPEPKPLAPKIPSSLPPRPLDDDSNDEPGSSHILTTDYAPLRAGADQPPESIFHEDHPQPEPGSFVDTGEIPPLPLAELPREVDLAPPETASAEFERPYDEEATSIDEPLAADMGPLQPSPPWWNRAIVGWSALASAVVVLGTAGGLYLYNLRDVPPSAPESSPLDVEIREAERLAEEAQLADSNEQVSLDVALEQARKARDLAVAKKASPFDVGRAEVVLDKLRRDEREKKLQSSIESIWFDEATGAMARIEKGNRAPTPNSVRYDEAFRTFGVDRRTDDSREAAEKLLTLQKPRLDVVIAALDDWATQADFHTQNWIGEVHSRTDQDHERMAVRLAVSRDDRHAVSRASRDGAILRQPTPQLLFICRVLMGWGRADDALALLTRAQAVRPRDFWVQHILGSAALRHEPPDLQLAAAAFSAADAIRPNAYSETQLGLAWSKLGRHDEALTFWRRALDKAPDYRNVRLLLAGANDPHRDTEDVVAGYEALRRDYPRDSEAPLAEGRFLVHRGMPDEALELFHEAASLGSAVAPVELGRLYAALHRHAESAQSYEWALELTPDDPDVLSAAAFEYAQLNRLDDAFDCAKLAVKMSPGDVNAHVVLASLYRRKHRADDAIAAAKRATQLGPQRADAWDALGLAYTEIDDSTAAIDAFQHAVALDPSFARAQAHLGSELAIVGRTSEAIGPLERAARLDPNDRITRRNLAAIFEQQRRWSEAVDAWEQVLHLEPGNADVRCSLAYALQQNGRFVDASATYTLAFAESPMIAEDLASLRRYDAARCAVSAAYHDDFPPDASVARVIPRPADLRRQSLEWLRADLVGWREKLAEDDGASARFAAANVFGHWLQEPALAPIRESQQLADLPTDERADWEELWKNVRRIRRDSLPASELSPREGTRTTVAKPPTDK